MSDINMAAKILSLRRNLYTENEIARELNIANKTAERIVNRALQTHKICRFCYALYPKNRSKYCSKTCKVASEA